MPIWAVRYKLGLLCQLPKPRFEAKVLFGDTLSFLVRRQNVAKTKGAFEGQGGAFRKDFYLLRQAGLEMQNECAEIKLRAE